MKPSDFITLLVPSPGVTPVDAASCRPYSDCYPVLLDGVMVGWVDKDLAPEVADALRRFKVIVYLCGLPYLLTSGVQSFPG